LPESAVTYNSIEELKTNSSYWKAAPNSSFFLKVELNSSNEITNAWLGFSYRGRTEKYLTPGLESNVSSNREIIQNEFGSSKCSMDSNNLVLTCTDNNFSASVTFNNMISISYSNLSRQQSLTISGETFGYGIIVPR
jgi:hypothetical protein